MCAREQKKGLMFQAVKKASALCMCFLLSIQTAAFAMPAHDLYLESNKNSTTFLTKTKPTPRTLHHIVNFLVEENIFTLEDYVTWFKANMTYKKDMIGGGWAAPEKTLKNRGGDCEDLAFFNAAVLQLFGYQPRVLAHGNLTKSHAFCIFQKDGTLYIFDNNRFYNTKATSLKQFTNYLAKHHKATYVLELYQNPQRLNFIYLKRQSQQTAINQLGLNDGESIY